MTRRTMRQSGNSIKAHRMPATMALVTCAAAFFVSTQRGR